MNVKEIPISKITPAPYNPRKTLKPGDPGYTRLLKSIEEFGSVEPLVWNRRTGYLISGNQRLAILVARGAKEVTVVVVDFSLEKEKALNLRLNNHDGQWDDRKLSTLLEELANSADIDLDLTGFTEAELESLLPDPGLDDFDEGFDPNAALEPDSPAVTKPGDILKLRDHILVCGDVQLPGVLESLVGENDVRLLLTDPPYNVQYQGDNRPLLHAKRGSRKTGQPPHGKTWDPIHGDQMSPGKYRGWLQYVLSILALILGPGAVYYIWNSYKHFGLMFDLAAEAGLKPAQVITWAKESFAPGFGDFNEQTEFCLYGWKPATGRSRKRHHFYGPKNASTLWEIHRDRTCDYHHPTQKPLELFERAIRWSSKPGECVLDPFLGSGTTLIAAARLGRRCLGMEIEPKFCDVIVRRYIALVGKSAVDPDIFDRYRMPSKEVMA